MKFDNKIVTIERYILDNQPDYARGDFSNLMYDLAMAAKMIANKTTRAGLADILGSADEIKKGVSAEKLEHGGNGRFE